VTLTICARCCEEVRYGARGGVTGWLHRDAVDHHAILGQPFTAEMAAEAERQLDVPRQRLAPGVSAHCPTYQGLWPLETYTTREHDLQRYRKKKSFRDAEVVEDDDEVAPLPPVEVWCHDVEPDSFGPRSGIRQVINLADKQGWERVRLTHARGPYVGSRGESLGISDSIVLGVRRERLDGSTSVAVASWRDGKFDFAFIGAIISGNLSTRSANATEMKTWIKGNDDLPDAVPSREP
jgi:hypothetical protein